MTNKIIRIASRKSPLALWQANSVAHNIKLHWPEIKTQIVPMQTKGDQHLKDRLQLIGGKGLFIKELETALLNNQADIAVHSMKDVPSNCPDGLELTAICKRESPYDALLSNKYNCLSEFPSGSIIGTSSLRRESQILASYPELKIKTLRGNIHTRIDKMKNGEYDGIILAESGLTRMSLQHEIKIILSEQIMLPACGQGALGIECRSYDHQILEIIKPLNDEETATCVRTERYVNRGLGGSCHSPIGVFCRLLDNKLKLSVKVLSLDGKQIVSSEQSGDIVDWQNIAEISLKILEQQGVRKLLRTNT